MARPIWTGSLSFGLVNVPVGLYSATEDRTVHFHQVQAGTNDRVRNKRVNERTGEEVEYSQIAKGYDSGTGDYVVVTPQELEALEPQRSRTIEVEDFVELAEIDPIYFRSSYFLAPQGEQAAHAYALLHQAMKGSGKVAVASFVMRGKEYLVAVRPHEQVLVLETMFFADEVRDLAEELDKLPSNDKFKGRELETAKLLIDSMTAKWEPDRYRDSYRQRVLELIEKKRLGEEVDFGVTATEPAAVVDLMAALEKSVAAAKERHRAAS